MAHRGREDRQECLPQLMSGKNAISLECLITQEEKMVRNVFHDHRQVKLPSVWYAGSHRTKLLPRVPLAQQAWELPQGNHGACDTVPFLFQEKLLPRVLLANRHETFHREIMELVTLSFTVSGEAAPKGPAGQQAWELSQGNHERDGGARCTRTHNPCKQKF